ncbi:MAG: sigma 54-interacting transcriptional regulator [Acidobacteriaceae bacterium]|nr:sigma 54-interacting transcriptional regulator [Acidobacteriaceae bacterium]MBV9499622.1 sigma 54-interacting transcriptional regulator [Acidobacteriaceae bacterium]
MSHSDLPRTLGALRSSRYFDQLQPERTLKEELRSNLICKLQRGETLFPGVMGFDDTVIPQIVNAILSRHNFILLGLRGQAKTRVARMLTRFLDPWMPYITGCEIRDHPLRPICKQCCTRVAESGAETPITWMAAEDRYVEKLATPDVTIADMIGDIDPIKAARTGQDISNELTIHYGLVPRANRGIFVINELPDLAGKVQVGLFNIMQEGDVQIKGYPVRLPLDVALVFTANPEDYTARGKIITPLKDRIGSEIRTHYPMTVPQGMAITEQEAWTNRRSPVQIEVPLYLHEVVEHVAFLAREDKRVDKRSGVSQRLPITVLENVISNAERRALRTKEPDAVPRILDLYAALPSITGKLELEYEGELKGGDAIGRELIKSAVGKVFNSYFDGTNLRSIVQWFEIGGSLRLDEDMPAQRMTAELGRIQDLLQSTKRLGLSENESDAMRASAGEFILEGLYAHKRISRNEELAFVAGERPSREERGRDDRDDFPRRGYDPRRGGPGGGRRNLN